MNDISIALQLAEHFRQENEGLKRELGRALTVPRMVESPIISFAGWRVAHVVTGLVQVTNPEGNSVTVTEGEPIFGLLAHIADWQSS